MSYLATTFGQHHLGKLIGIGFLASAMVSVLQVRSDARERMHARRDACLWLTCVAHAFPSPQSPLLHFVLGPLDGNFTWGNVALMVALGAMSPYAVMLPGPPKRAPVHSAEGGSPSMGGHASGEAAPLLGDGSDAADAPGRTAEHGRPRRAMRSAATESTGDESGALLSAAA